jgi:hypothetical protein
MRKFFLYSFTTILVLFPIISFATVWDVTDADIQKMQQQSASAPETKGNILWIDVKKLREGDVDMNTIPVAIAGVIEWLLAIAGTVSVVALIYHSVQMQLNSGITGDSSWVDKAKKWMIASLVGFVISLLWWFLVSRFAEILSSLT